MNILSRTLLPILIVGLSQQHAHPPTQVSRPLRLNLQLPTREQFRLLRL